MENDKTIVPKCERAYGVCKLKNTTTDHYILCVVTFLWVPLNDERKHVVKKPETLENLTY